MISARGATPCNLMLNEVGRAHVANAIPIVYQPGEVFKVWSALCSYLRGALLGGVNVSIFRRTLSFSCSKRKVFKKIPASFHRESQTFDLRVPLFGVSAAFATTYSLDSPLVEDAALVYSQLPAKVLADGAGVPVAVVSAVLHDIMRFIGEGLYQGRLLELDFPGVAHVRVKRDRVMAVFDDEFTAELLAIDTRKWPAVFAKEARELLLRKRPTTTTTTAAASSAADQQQARPSSARPSSARSKALTTPSTFKPASAFVNAPAPAGRTFDEINEERQNEMNRQKRRTQFQQKRAASATAQQQKRDQQFQKEFNNDLAVVYDESVPASSLSPAKINGKSASRVREESVYDMVMPSANHQVPIPTSNSNGGGQQQNQFGASTTGAPPPQAATQQPPQPMNKHQDPTANNAAVAAPVTTNALFDRVKTAKRFARSYQNIYAHNSIFDFDNLNNKKNNNNNNNNGGGADQENNNNNNNNNNTNSPYYLQTHATGKKRFDDNRNQNQPTTALGGSKDPFNARIQRDIPDGSINSAEGAAVTASKQNSGGIVGADGVVTQ